MLKITQSILEQIRRHGEETYPHECCGVLLGRMDAENNVREVSRSVRAGNTHADSPQNRYNIDPRELIAAQRLAREAGEDIVGFYHSHPDHPARWSETDFNEAHWYGCSYVITTVKHGRADVTNSFVLTGSSEEDKRFVDEPIQVLAGEAKLVSGV
jgi:proteasome lid subunit RPN8/RPN11